MGEHMVKWKDGEQLPREYLSGDVQAASYHCQTGTRLRAVEFRPFAHVPCTINLDHGG